MGKNRSNETSARSAFEWARAVGSSWRRDVVRIPDNARLLLSVAFEDEGLAPARSPRDALCRHDRAIGVCVVLSGLSPETIAERAARDERTLAFAEAAAWAWSVGDREPEAFATACRTFRSVRQAWDDGIAAGLEGWSGPARGAVFERARSVAGSARRRGVAWAVAGWARARRSRDCGFVDAVRGTVAPESLVRDASYRAGVVEGATVASLTSRAGLEIELRLREARRFGRRASR